MNCYKKYNDGDTVKSAPTLQSLLSPPAGKTGWPWTEGSTLLPPVMPDGTPWPRVSIVTPSFNQGWALEETLRSVILQGYPNLEYIVMDDGSTDGSQEIIKRYEPWLSYWQTAPNQGQTPVIYQGFERATGSVLGWLNSDDLLLPNALSLIIGLRSKYPDAPAWVGTTHEISRDGAFIRAIVPSWGTKEEFFNWSKGKLHFHQPGCFFSADAYRKAGGLDVRMWCTMDMDLWLRLRDLGDFALADIPVASARIYAEMKSAGGAGNPKSLVDLITIALKHNRREMAEMYVRNSKDSWRLEVARQLTPDLALRYIDPEKFMDQLSLKKIAKYSVRRMLGSM